MNDEDFLLHLHDNTRRCNLYLQGKNIDAFYFQVCNFPTYFISIYKDKTYTSSLVCSTIGCVGCICRRGEVKN